jgi:hypothetical protein
MPRRCVVAIGLLSALLAGCTTAAPVQSATWLARLRPFCGPSGAGVVEMHVALIERPIGDPFINQEVWLVADEQAVPFERKSVLEENGFRVGQIGGTTPAGLQRLLTSEKTCTGRKLFIHNEKPGVVSLGPSLPTCSFDLNLNDNRVPAQFDRAECLLEAVPNLLPDGRIRIQLTPQIRHGDARLTPGVAEDHAGWAILPQKPMETYTPLHFEINLRPNEYILIGARIDRAGSLGYQTFVRTAEEPPVQRLLVIRACRAGPTPASEMADGSDDKPPSTRSRPLAAQAAYTPVNEDVAPDTIAAK